MRDKKTVVLSIFFLVIGIIIGVISSGLEEDISNTSEIRSGGYKLINPLYECLTDESLGGKELGSLEKKLQEYADDHTRHPGVERISVYFRDLNNGPWFGVNQDSTFTPSSLLKLPIAIAFYKKAESEPIILKTKVKYEQDFGDRIPDQKFDPAKPIEKGKTYTIEQLIESMIEGSDNEALLLLTDGNKYIKNEDIERVFKELDLPGTLGQSQSSEYMSVKAYSSLFRVLYNASYLNRDNSEKVLELLSKVDFAHGLRKPIPENITIANKFGERRSTGLAGLSYQLHDCGIVYYTDHPYLLCLMSEGTDYDSLLKVIQEISKEVYNQIDSIYKDTIKAP